MRNRTTGFLICLWLVGLLPALVSHLTPHVIRSQFGLISSAIITAYGFISFIFWLKNRKLKFLTVGIFLISTLVQLSFYLYTYFGTYALSSAKYFQFGYKQAIEDVNKFKFNDENIYITTKYEQPYIYLLLYNRITPQEFLFGGLNQYKIMPINWDNPEKGLYLATPDEIPVTDPRVIKVISVPKSQEPVLVIARNQ